MGVLIKDVATRAGVSAATVSNVLNGRHERVSAETRAAVLRAAAELDYRRRERAPRTPKREQTLGLIVANIASPLFVQAISGVEAVATRFGYRLLLCNNRGREANDLVSAQALLARRVDGILFVASSRYAGRDAFDAVVGAGVPCAVVNRVIDPEAALHVLSANEEGTYDAASHLIRLGHRRLAYLHLPTDGPPVVQAAVERMRGFARALADNRLNAPPHWLRPGVLGDEGAPAIGHALAREWLAGGPRPSAILCGSDNLAVGVMRAVHEAGLRIPDDVAVVGHDDAPFARHLTPALTTVRQPMEEAGARAAEALIQHLWKGASLQGVERLPCRLAIRASSTAYINSAS